MNPRTNASTVEEAQAAIMDLLGIGPFHATAILDMQVRRLAATERQKILDEQVELRAFIREHDWRGPTLRLRFATRVRISGRRNRA